MPANLIAAMDRYAGSHGLTRSEVIRVAVERMLGGTSTAEKPKALVPGGGRTAAKVAKVVADKRARATVRQVKKAARELVKATMPALANTLLAAELPEAELKRQTEPTKPTDPTRCPRCGASYALVGHAHRCRGGEG